MSSAEILQPVVEHGWRSGFTNLLRKENNLWWATRKWWVHTLIWLLISNGIIAFILWVIPLFDPSGDMNLNGSGEEYAEGKRRAPRGDQRMTRTEIGGGSRSMQTHATTCLYLEDGHCFEAKATVVAARENALAFDRACFYPGGGGQPADEGSVKVRSGEVLEIVSVQADLDEILWHITKSPPPAAILGQPAKLTVSRARRLALMRYHTVLHVLNTIALRDYGGWITGVKIGVDYSRIDFKLEGFSAAMGAELEKKVLTVLNHFKNNPFSMNSSF